jgi:polysaccharide biosynthesis/export protein
MDVENEDIASASARHCCPGLSTSAAALCILSLVGCYAPLHSPGIPARELPDSYRWPVRTAATPLNYSTLVTPPPATYLLGTEDLVEVLVPDLISEGTVFTVQTRVLENGEIQLPRVGGVPVAGLSLASAQHEINSALAQELLVNPGATISLVEKSTTSILVLGAVQRPGVYALPRFENDVAHALASAEGFSEDAGEVIEIHRRGPGVAPICPPVHETPVTLPPSNVPTMTQIQYRPSSRYGGAGGHSPAILSANMTAESPPSPEPVPEQREPHQAVPGPIIRIPLHDDGTIVLASDVALHPGDVIVIPNKTDKVFYVVGPLSQQNRVRFSVGSEDREIGNGFLLPDDRELDVVTAVAMAGYIDPIESPTTVTVHRVRRDGTPLLVKVDLIAARSDPKETILIQPGDIIYLNPDSAWYTRRLMDRVIDRALGTAIGRWLTQ